MHSLLDIEEIRFFGNGVANLVDEPCIYVVNYTFSCNMHSIRVMIDHENIGMDTLFVILSCIVCSILRKLGFSVMASLTE